MQAPLPVLFMRADDVQQVGVVALLLRAARPRRSAGSGHRFAGREPGGPGLVGERRIGDDVVVGAELLAVLELGIGQRVAREDVGRREVVQDHVHAGEAGGGHVLLLPFERDVLAGLGGHLQQQRARAAGGVVGGGGRPWCSRARCRSTLAMMRLTSAGV